MQRRKVKEDGATRDEMRAGPSFWRDRMRKWDKIGVRGTINQSINNKNPHSTK